MDTIASFQIDHRTLLPGLYVSRRDEKNGGVVTTFDLRLTAPNREPVVDMPAATIPSRIWLWPSIISPAIGRHF